MTTTTEQPGRPAAVRLARPLAESAALREALGALIALASWETTSRGGLVDARYLPPPSAVLPRAAGLLTDPVFLRHALAVTVTSWLLGLAAAAAVAVPAGALLGAVPVLELAGRAIIEALRPIPAVALLPVVTVAFGIGAGTRVSLVVLAASWPILLNTIAGIRACDPALVDVARIHGHTHASILARVRLPAAAPLIATGLRISASIGLVATVSLELVTGTDEGLGGYLVLVASGGDNTTTVLAVTVLSGLLGLAINTAATRAERAAFASHQPGHRS
jgi:NitT/TauT family transport system permease protein